MASTEGNVLLLTNRGEEGSLTREIFESWEGEQAETARWGRGRIGNPTSTAEQLRIEVS
jgi:cleavage and polyadenylation specificity factor subunit 2